MLLINKYLDDPNMMFNYNNGCWYVGTANSVDSGISLLFKHLDKVGYVIVEYEVFDYLYYGSEIHYAILYKVLRKLDYLEHMAKRVDKNQKDCKTIIKRRSNRGSAFKSILKGR